MQSDIITPEELRNLPHHALVAFAARCARRLLSHFKGEWKLAPKKHLEAVEHAIALAEQFASGQIVTQTEVSLAMRAVKDAADAASKTSVFQYEISSIPYYAPEYSPIIATVASHAVDSILSGISAAANVTKVGSQFSLFTNEVRRDLRILQEGITARRIQETTLIPPSFFALFSQFDPTQPVAQNQNIIQIVSLIELKAIEIAGDPRKLFTLSSKEFEELIAEVIGKFGFEVELTKQTRDGGRDIIAINHHFASVKYLVECKRYAPTNTVGISVVQRLHGVRVAEGATKGLVVTTSRFTKQAKIFMEQQKWVLEGRDFDGLVEWLKLYDQITMQKDYKLH